MTTEALAEQQPQWMDDADPKAPWVQFGERYRHSFHMGLYLAVNAIPGSYAVIDGPDCLYRKAEWIHVSHDMSSELLDPCGEHRIVSTLVNAEAVIKSHGQELVARLRRVATIPAARVVFVNSMPHVTIIGTQYDKLIAQVADNVPFPIIEVPSRSLSGDWLDGYADTLEALAGSIDLRGGELRPDRVAVIGHLMDRNEADQVANVTELERTISGAGLDCVSVWLSGRPMEHLACVRDAGLLVALPHGRKAAARLAQRTGAKVVEVDLPLGLPATQAFVRAISRAAGTEEVAARWFDAEVARATPRLEWAIQRFMVGCRVAFAGDPAWFAPLAATLEEVGARLVYAVTPSARPLWAPETITTPSGRTLAPVWAPALRQIKVDTHAPGHERRSCDVVLSDSVAAQRFARESRIPVGFPCFERHAVFETPFLGVAGWLWLMDSILRLRLQAADEASRHP